MSFLKPMNFFLPQYMPKDDVVSCRFYNNLSEEEQRECDEVAAAMRPKIKVKSFSDQLRESFPSNNGEFKEVLLQVLRDESVLDSSALQTLNFYCGKYKTANLKLVAFYLGNDASVPKRPVRRPYVSYITVNPAPVIDVPRVIELIENPNLPFVSVVDKSQFKTVYDAAYQSSDKTQLLRQLNNLTSRRLGMVSTNINDRYMCRVANTYYYFNSNFNLVEDLRVYTDYIDVVYSNRVEVDILSQDYSQIFLYGKVLYDRLSVACNVVRNLPKKYKYYVPGDGHGCFSYAFRINGCNYFSSEPNEVGNLPNLMGIITSRDYYNRELDDGSTVLFASNLRQYVDFSNWSGPVIIFDVKSYDYTDEGYEYVHYTSGQLWTRGIQLTISSGDSSLDFSTKLLIRSKRFLNKLLVRTGALKIIVLDCLHSALLNRLKIDHKRQYPGVSTKVKVCRINKVKKKKKLIYLGTGEEGIDLFHMQDHKYPNGRGIFIGKKRDIVHLKGHHPLKFGEKLYFVNEKEMKIVNCKFRNEKYPRVMSDSGGRDYILVVAIHAVGDLIDVKRNKHNIRMIVTEVHFDKGLYTYFLKFDDNFREHDDALAGILPK